MKLAEKLTKKIFENYPKIWKELEKYDNKAVCQNYFRLVYTVHYKRIFYTIIDSDGWNYIPVPFDVLYGLLENIFKKKYKIIIDIGYDYEDDNYYFDLYKNQSCIYASYDWRFENKNETRYQAILKAMEYLK